jgi:hypothetical protein
LLLRRQRLGQVFIKHSRPPKLAIPPCLPETPRGRRERASLRVGHPPARVVGEAQSFQLALSWRGTFPSSAGRCGLESQNVFETSHGVREDRGGRLTFKSAGPGDCKSYAGPTGRQGPACGESGRIGRGSAVEEATQEDENGAVDELDVARK